MSEVTEISIKGWIKRGGMLLNAECLPITDPDHVYNQALRQGVRPEDFGIKHPYAAEFEDKTRDELISMVVDLRLQLEAQARFG